MSVGNRVLELLASKGLKQKDLALFLGTKPSTINGWKEPNRNPSSDLIIRICDFLGVSCEYLLTGKDIPTASVSSEDAEWLSIIHRLPEKKQIDFKARMEGYLECYEESVAADEPLGNTGTDMGK